MTTASVLLAVATPWGGGRAGPRAGAVASAELRETPAARAQALHLMRDWIAMNEDIRNVRLDDSFLLRFLRHKKFSVPMAQQTLLKYLSLRSYYPHSFNRLDCLDPALAEIFAQGYIVVSPVRDSHGRRVIIYKMGKFDASKFTCWQLCRAHAALYESLLESAEEQVLGFTHVGDGGGVSAAHVALWNPVDLARLVKWGEQSLPMRHKECHLVNIHASIKYAIDFAASKVSAKMADRLRTHTSVQQLHKFVDPACLPTEYGGAVPHRDMVEHTRQVLREHRGRVVDLDRMEILSTRGIVSSRRPTGPRDTEAVQGSFRKLEID